MYTHYNQEGKYGQANISGMLPSTKIRGDHYMTLYGKKVKGVEEIVEGMEHGLC